MTSTARPGPLLRSGSPRSYKGLGVSGRTVFSAAQQMRLTIRRKLGPEAAELLAVPQISESGDNIDWYAPFDGPVAPWSAATPEERDEAARHLQQARETYLRQGETELANGVRGDHELFAKMLPLSLRIPDDGHIYLVGNRPVVTFWSFEPLTAPVNYDVIRDLRGLPEAPAPAAAQPLPVAEPPARPWWRWLLWLLLLLLLLALLLFGLRACNVNVPLPGLNLPNFGADITVPEPNLPNGPNLPGVTVPGVGVPGIGVPGAGGPGTGMDGSGAALPPGSDPASDGAGSDPAADPNAADQGTPPGEEPPPADDPAAETPPDQQPPPQPEGEQPAQDPSSGQDQPPQDGATPPEPNMPPQTQAPQPPPPLVIPPEALANGSTDFLNGRWTSRTGLMDSETGRPIEMEYDFQDGQGTATLRRSDGVQCSAPAQATMQSGRLVIDQTADATCPDGQVFQRSTVECVAGQGGRANCTGANADGAGYNVQIVQ